MMANLIRRLMCRFGWCGMVQESNDTHIWGECPRCGRVAGVVSRDSVRRYIEAEARNEKFREEQEVLRKSIIAQAKAPTGDVGGVKQP